MLPLIITHRITTRVSVVPALVSVHVHVCLSERLEQEAEDAERRRLEEMSEEEYDAMTEAQKAAVDRKRLEIKKERLRK